MFFRFSFILAFLHFSTHLPALPEKYYQEIVAQILNGKTEVTMTDRTRCDIVTKTHAIEVDWSKKWGESIGQSLNYSFQTNKRGGIVLITDTPTDINDVTKVNSIIGHYKLPITLWVIDKETETLKQFSAY
tara:strand:+ start:1451 stop:1843 length:393 start_codon:yes stop_codon:yes gene_type:complete